MQQQSPERLCLAKKRQRRSGKIALLAAIILLLIAVLMAWIGNMGNVVKQKMEVQNAADATSFASSMWMARSMNAITVSNHLIGEATAIGVIHDAIGGPEMRLGLKTNTQENRQLDSIIRTLAAFAPIGTPTPNSYIPSPITRLDRDLIEFLRKRTSPDNDPDLTAFATLYDSKMSLQRLFALALGTKSLANIILMIPKELIAVPVFGQILAVAVAAAIVTHVAASASIVAIAKEWLLLEVMQTYAQKANPIQETAFAKHLIPTLAEFPAAIAGLDLEAPENKPDGGFAVNEIKQTIDKADNQQNVAAQIVPATDKRRLPVQFEPKPNRKGRSGEWPEEWGTDQVLTLPSAASAFDSVKDSLTKIINGMNKAGSASRKAINDLEDLKKDIEEEIEANDELSDDVKEEYKKEIETIDETVADIQAQLDEIEKSKNDTEKRRDSILDSFPLPSGQSQNLSLDHVPNDMDPQQERSTQWTRATMPNVNAMRAPILGLMKSQMPLSGAAKHYEKWTNRYTMIRAWKFRSGMRLEKTGTAAAQWQSASDPLHMVVIAGSFDQETSIKGSETWTRNDEAGKQLAEDQFTLLTAVHRPYQSLLATRVLRNGQQDGLTAFAQSIVYNANRQSSSGGPSSQQPQVGWDTLNWINDGTNVPEWGTEAIVQSMTWPWELLDGLENAPKVKLNWQPKLMPVTATRLELAAEKMGAETQQAMELSSEHQELVNH